MTEESTEVITIEDRLPVDRSPVDRLPVNRPPVRFDARAHGWWRAFGLGLLLLAAIATRGHAQDEPAPIMNESGDTIAVTFPPPVGTYNPHQVIVKFVRGVLDPSVLCFTVPAPQDTVEQGEITVQGMPSAFKSQIMGQAFHIDSGIILDAGLRSGLRSMGGLYLRRMTSANPCTDTFTVARNGDTLPADDYDWMVMLLDTTSNPVTVVTALRDSTYNERVEMAGLDVYLHPDAVPDDLYYRFRQIGLQGDGIGADVAWNYQTGNYNIKVAVIDDGLDWRHNELGGDMGSGRKVSGGWSYTENNKWFEYGSYHGTQCAGIIGAETNNGNLGGGRFLISGIGGGWNNGAPGGTVGVQMLGFRTEEYNGDPVSKVAAAIREASARSRGYGYGVHLMNVSLGFDNYDEVLRSAVNSAIGNYVTVVASRGNDDNWAGHYPATLDNSWVLSVGAAGWHKERASGFLENNQPWASSYGGGMDCIAPGKAGPDDNGLYWITTTGYSGDDGSNRINVGLFSGTSAAAPHTAGVVGLLLSEGYEQLTLDGDKPWMAGMDREDIEGIIKAACSDRTQTTNPGEQYARGYDPYTAWGHVQADSLFEMLHEDYRVWHLSLAPTWYGQWQQYNTFWLQNNFRGNRQPLPPGMYRVQRREVRATTYAYGDYDAGAPMFVWGRGGTNGGWSAAHPNYQSTFSEVTNGSWGNGQVPGIRHTPGQPITLRTYQYRVLPLHGMLQFGPSTPVYPANPQLNLSIFAKPSPLKARDGSGGNDGGGGNDGAGGNDGSGGNDGHLSDVAATNGDAALRASIVPNPARSVMHLRHTVPGGGTARIVVSDVLGRIVLERTSRANGSVERTMSIRVDDLSAGTYRCTVSTGTRTTTVPFVVVR